jgi:hypothetical protein
MALPDQLGNGLISVFVKAVSLQNTLHLWMSKKHFYRVKMQLLLQIQVKKRLN